MTTRWDKVNAIFDRALDLPEAERGAFLDEACGEDAEMRGEIARLLAAHALAGGFIEKPLHQEFERIASSRGGPAPGSVIGAWRILREIGRGGMGTVWLGERTDQDFEQRVAIKLVHSGMDADWVLRRFQTERRILAGLEHPHIARLLDGGTTDQGVPFFVMEFIDGDPIDQFCDERRLSVTKRLELFRQVCAAVAYAHQNLIIHRDIKPSNVLVARDGSAKLLDFGVATILDDHELSHEQRTATVQQLMTPEYASPEQIRGLPATTLGDVYALGVVLYELLSGRTPYRFPSRSLPEIARVLEEERPERPSTAITSSHPGRNNTAQAVETAERICAAREGSVDRLRRRLRGDLDTIVLKAIHIDPQQRYVSVDQFSEDIRRHLAGLPVIARPDTFAYRTRKFVRRNRVAVGAAMLVGLTLIGGAMTTAWQASRAREAQARAERRFGDLRKLAHAVLFDYHDAVKDLAGSTPVRERLVTDGLEYLDGLAQEAGDDVTLQRELADAYLRMGDVQGGVAANLGNTEGAMESYQKAHATYASLVASDSTNVENRRGLADCLLKLSELLRETGEIPAAIERTQRARLTLESLVRDAPQDLGLQRQLVGALDTEGLLVHETGDFAAALELRKRQLGQSQAILTTNPRDPAARRGLAVAYGRLSKVKTALADYESALEYNRQSLGVRKELADEFPLNAEYRRMLAVAFSVDGGLLATLSRTRDAQESYEQNLAIIDELLAADPKNELYRSDRGHALASLGDVKVLVEDLPGARDCYRASLAIRSAEFESDPSNNFKRIPVISAQSKLGKVLAKLGDHVAAGTHAGEALELLDATVADSTNAGLRAAMAECYGGLGEIHSAVASGKSQKGRGTKRQAWLQALSMFERSEAIWLDLRRRDLLAETDVSQLDSVSRDVAQCRAALGGKEEVTSPESASAPIQK